MASASLAYCRSIVGGEAAGRLPGFGLEYLLVCFGSSLGVTLLGVELPSERAGIITIVIDRVCCRPSSGGRDAFAGRAHASDCKENTIAGEGTDDRSPSQATPPKQAEITDRWRLWLLGAVLLVAIGFGALAVLGDGKTATGEDDTSLLNGLAYFTWLLSWLGAAGSGLLGLVGGVKELARRRA